MMFSVRRVVRIGAVALLVTGPVATASPLTHTDTFAPGEIFLNAVLGVTCVGSNALVDTVAPAPPCKAISFNHVIDGYSNPPDVLTSATLTISYRDDGGSGDGSEKYDLVFDAASQTNIPINGGVGGASDLFDVFATAQDGLLQVLITASTGDFYFVSSVLNAAWEHLDDASDLAPVPEPSSLLLLGTGALVVAGIRRRRRA